MEAPLSGDSQPGHQQGWEAAVLVGTSTPTPNSQPIVGGGGQSGGQATAPGKSAAEFEN